MKVLLSRKKCQTFDNKKGIKWDFLKIINHSSKYWKHFADKFTIIMKAQKPSVRKVEA